MKKLTFQINQLCVTYKVMRVLLVQPLFSVQSLSTAVPNTENDNLVTVVEEVVSADDSSPKNKGGFSIEDEKSIIENFAKEMSLSAMNYAMLFAGHGYYQSHVQPKVSKFKKKFGEYKFCENVMTVPFFKPLVKAYENAMSRAGCFGFGSLASKNPLYLLSYRLDILEFLNSQHPQLCLQKFIDERWSNILDYLENMNSSKDLKSITTKIDRICNEIEERILEAMFPLVEDFQKSEAFIKAYSYIHSEVMTMVAYGDEKMKQERLIRMVDEIKSLHLANCEVLDFISHQAKTNKANDSEGI